MNIPQNTLADGYTLVMSLAVRWTAGQNWARILEFNTENNSYPGLWFNGGDGAISLWDKSGSHGGFGGGFSKDRIINLVLTYKDGTLHAYLRENGQMFSRSWSNASQFAANKIVDGNSAFEFFSNTTAGWTSLLGKFFQLKVYDGVLSADEVQNQWDTFFPAPSRFPYLFLEQFDPAL